MSEAIINAVVSASGKPRRSRARSLEQRRVLCGQNIFYRSLKRVLKAVQTAAHRHAARLVRNYYRPLHERRDNRALAGNRDSQTRAPCRSQMSRVPQCAAYHNSVVVSDGSTFGQHRKHYATAGRIVYCLHCTLMRTPVSRTSGSASTVPPTTTVWPIACGTVAAASPANKNPTAR